VKKTPVFLTIIFLAAISIWGCQKSGDDNHSSIDETKLTNKNWGWGGSPAWIVMRLNSDKTGVQKNIKDLFAATYNEFSFTWAVKGDSVNIKYENYGTDEFSFKVYSVNDSVLVTNNWVLGGVSDTGRTSFKAFK
jgi:hypothetical protein